MLAKDEADMIGTNIRHHLALGLSGFVVFDNMSQDGTGGIARSLGAHVFLDEEVAFRQQAKNRSMTEIAVGFGAEWVLTVDADELWYPTRDSNIPEAIASLPPGTDAIRALSFDHACCELDDEAEADPVLRMRWRRNSPGVGKVAHRCLDGAYAWGGNESWVLGGEVLDPAVSNCLRIRHYPVRGLTHLKRKARTGWVAVNGQAGVSRKACGHWRKWYRKYREDPVWFRSFFEWKIRLSRARIGREPGGWKEDPFTPAHSSPREPHLPHDS